MKNYIARTFWLTLIIFATLVALHYLPTLTLDGHTLRRVDIFADIRPPKEDSFATEIDSLLPPPPKPVFIDTCKAGITCIEDYSDSTMRGMKLFYEALDHTRERPVRIAVFGDSFIEADIFTADLREMLQKRFGGCGVGFVPMTSKISGYRPTVRHHFSGWESHSVTDTLYFNKSKQGISGHYFIPRQGAYAELSGQSKYASRLDTCEIATLYFASAGPVSVRSSINRAAEYTHTAGGHPGLSFFNVEGRIGRVRWTVEQADSALFYGLAMDGRKGMAVDNFSLRGSSGLSLRNIPAHTLAGFNKQRPYDLIILQYGLNVATEKGRDYSPYQKGMLTVIEHLKKSFPHAGILILSVGDRDYKTETGELKTMPGVKNLVRYQQAIAAESGVAFWNMFEAMGADGSMAKLVHAKPSLANFDYTHINFRGGEYLAGLLFETLMYGKEQYERRKAYDRK